MKKLSLPFLCVLLVYMFSALDSKAQEKVSIVQSIPLNVNVISSGSTTFTYKVVSFDCNVGRSVPAGPADAAAKLLANMENEINELGKQGWELVSNSIYHSNQGNSAEQCMLIFKKSLKANATN